jgi:hypothetical protein
MDGMSMVSPMWPFFLEKGENTPHRSNFQDKHAISGLRFSRFVSSDLMSLPVISSPFDVLGQVPNLGDELISDIDPPVAKRLAARNPHYACHIFRLPPVVDELIDGLWDQRAIELFGEHDVELPVFSFYSRFVFVGCLERTPNVASVALFEDGRATLPDAFSLQELQSARHQNHAADAYKLPTAGKKASNFNGRKSVPTRRLHS